MAELLLRVRDKPGHNPWLLGEHEVVAVCDDAWPWSAIELASPDWRIVCLPGVSKLDAVRWSVPEASADPDYHVVRRRHFKLDPGKFPLDFAVWYADDSRQAPRCVVPEAMFERLFRERKPLPRRDVIGALPRTVIG